MSLSFVYPPILSASDRKYGVVQVDDCVLGRRKLDVVNLATTMYCVSVTVLRSSDRLLTIRDRFGIVVHNERQAKMPVDQSQTLYKGLRTHFCQCFNEYYS